MDRVKFRLILEQRTSINSQTECWEYKGVNSDGYGQVTIDYEFYYVHVLSAQIFLNYVPKPNLMVCHKPMCKSRNCWNPDHLYIGTVRENNWDIARANNLRGRFSNVTHCVSGHEFTDQNTYWSRRGLAGEMRRQCRACRITRDRERKTRMRLLKAKVS